MRSTINFDQRKQTLRNRSLQTTRLTFNLLLLQYIYARDFPFKMKESWHIKKNVFGNGYKSTKEEKNVIRSPFLEFLVCVMKKKIKQKTSVTDHLFHIKKKTHWENSQRNYFALFRVVVQKTELLSQSLSREQAVNTHAQAQLILSLSAVMVTIHTSQYHSNCVPCGHAHLCISS